MTTRVRELLDEAQEGFAEVVLMLPRPSITAEIYTLFEDLRYTEDGNIVTFMAEGGTHVHLHLDQVKEVRFSHRIKEDGAPTYSVWFIDSEGHHLMRVYLRKSDKDETNPLRHNLYMRLRDKYGESFQVV